MCLNIGEFGVVVNEFIEFELLYVDVNINGCFCLLVIFLRVELWKVIFCVLLFIFLVDL